MGTINLAEKKMMLFRKIIDIENEKAINTLTKIIDKILLINQSEINIEDLTFEEWNSLLMEDKDLNELISEYGITLGEYRRKIYEAEKSESYPIQQFLDKLESYGK